MNINRVFNFCVRATLCASLLFLSSHLSTSIARAQDISGGASESNKPKSAAPRRAKRTTQPAKTTKRSNAKATSQAKINLTKQVEAALELGNSARDSNPPNHVAAERAYKLATELDATDARPFVGLGNTYFDQKRYAEADAAFRRAIQLDPDDAGAYVALAYVNNAMERYDEAERAAQRALVLDANDYTAYVALGWSEFRRKNYQQAEVAYRRAISLSPKTQELYSELGVVLMAQGRWRDSELLLREAVALDPTDAAALADYGVVLHKLGQLEKAAETYAQVSRLDPKMSAPHSNLALVQYTRGDFAKAREEWETALRLNSPYALDRAGLLILERKLAEAQAELEKHTQTTDAADEDGWLLLGDVRRMQGDDAGARAAYARAAQIAPDYAQHGRPTVPAPQVAKASPTPPEKMAANNGSTANTAADAVKASSGQSTADEPKLLYATSVRTIKATNFSKATIATGAILITCQSNAKILIEPVAGGEAQMTVVPPSDQVVAFNQLRPGEYRVVASLDGHQTAEVKVFVAVTRVVSIKLNLRAKT
jgi:tetratricopeptide (TPR) repeat protein